MKYLLFAASILAASCKQMPIKSQCRQVYNVKQVWSDSAAEFLRSDTTWRSNGVICGEELQRLSSFPDSWVKICNPDGTTHYWEHWVVVTR
jgi:hypothetical protein